MRDESRSGWLKGGETAEEQERIGFLRIIMICTSNQHNLVSILKRSLACSVENGSVEANQSISGKVKLRCLRVT